MNGTAQAFGEDRIERDKSIIDYMKHMATLSSGALVLLSGFSDKFIIVPENKNYFKFAISSFLLSIIVNLFATSLSLFGFFGRRGDRSRVLGGVFAFLVIVAGLAMLAGFAFIGRCAFNIP